MSDKCLGSLKYILFSLLTFTNMFMVLHEYVTTDGCISICPCSMQLFICIKILILSGMFDS